MTETTEKHPKLDKLEDFLDEIAGYWNGEDDKYIGGDGEVYTEEDADMANEAIEKLKELKILLTEMGVTF